MRYTKIFHIFGGETCRYKTMRNFLIVRKCNPGARAMAQQ